MRFDSGQVGAISVRRYDGLVVDLTGAVVALDARQQPLLKRLEAGCSATFGIHPDQHHGAARPVERCHHTARPGHHLGTRVEDPCPARRRAASGARRWHKNTIGIREQDPFVDWLAGDRGDRHSAIPTGSRCDAWRTSVVVPKR
jgi:hypothetical protein